MSPLSIQSGAREHDSRYRCGLSGCRTLMWPKESTTPSRARMRFAVTSSSIRWSSLDIGFSPRAPLHPATYMRVRKGVNSATSLAISAGALPIELFTSPAKALVSLAHGRAMAENPVPVCATADVPSGSVKSFDVGDERIAIYNIEGTFYATEAHCTHAMADLGDGILEGDVIECSLHFGAFHVPSGKAVH